MSAGRFAMSGMPVHWRRWYSKLAADTFPDAPVIHSELVNRERPSSNSQAAVRVLLHAMVSVPGEENLGIEDYPAERGLYSTVLEVAGLHGHVGGSLGFKAPNGRSPIGKSFVPMWLKAEEILKAADDPVSLASLYEVWAAPPFGIRRGLLPILGMAFVLAHDSSVAVYAEERFQPDLNDFVADRLLQDERLISLRFVGRQAHDRRFMGELAETVEEIVGQAPVAEPLAVARALVEFVYRLPNWTRRTLSLSREAQNVRRVMLNASDPYRALFIDLPHAVGGKSAKQTRAKLAEALRELKGAYPAMLDDLCRRMLKALGHKGADFSVLRERAQTVAGVSGDLRLDAFATRLVEFDGRREDTEVIAGLVIHKPARDWSDMEPSQAAFELAEHALRFRQAEVLAMVQDRSPTQHAVAVVFGTGEAGRAVMKSFDVAISDLDEINALAGRIVELLRVRDWTVRYCWPPWPRPDCGPPRKTAEAPCLSRRRWHHDREARSWRESRQAPPWRCSCAIPIPASIFATSLLTRARSCRRSTSSSAGLEGFLGKPHLIPQSPDRDFDFWEYGNFLPSPRTRWCTRQLKLRPFEKWIRDDLRSGVHVVSYVAIRADEPGRIGMHATHPNLEVRFPFRDHGFDKAAVLDLLESSGLGLPSYYRWRSRSGCTFCFYQQKVEWVRLKREHPDAFEEAKRYEKTALDHGSPFTWSDRESLAELEQPERIAEIEADYERRLAREKARRPKNALREGLEDVEIDEVYGTAEVAASCMICHK